jgi:hypothetical protein
MSCDALPWLRDIFLQQFGQENQQVNEPGFLFSNCCKKNETTVHLIQYFSRTTTKHPQNHVGSFGCKFGGQLT